MVCNKSYTLFVWKGMTKILYDNILWYTVALMLCKLPAVDTNIQWNHKTSVGIPVLTFLISSQQPLFVGPKYLWLCFFLTVIALLGASIFLYNLPFFYSIPTLCNSSSLTNIKNCMLWGDILNLIHCVFFKVYFWSSLTCEHIYSLENIYLKMKWNISLIEL